MLKITKLYSDAIRVSLSPAGDCPNCWAKRFGCSLSSRRRLGFVGSFSLFSPGTGDGVFRPALQVVKEKYDNADSYQTPFALRQVTDPAERHFLLRNIFSFATVNGCTGGQWGCGRTCYLAALQFKDAKKLEVVPLAQKKHFFDEVLGSMNPEEREKWVNNFYMHDDNDPFDDPDLVELADYFYTTYNVVVSMTTTIPRGREEVFERLAGDAKKYERIEMLECFVEELKRVHSVLRASLFSSVGEWGKRCKEVTEPYDNLSS